MRINGRWGEEGLIRIHIRGKEPLQGGVTLGGVLLGRALMSI